MSRKKHTSTHNSNGNGNTDRNTDTGHRHTYTKVTNCQLTIVLVIRVCVRVCFSACVCVCAREKFAKVAGEKREARPTDNDCEPHASKFAAQLPQVNEPLTKAVCLRG